MHKKELQGIFFDFDGVLVDSWAIKEDGFRRLFTDYDKEIIDKIIAYHRRHGGISRVQKIHWAHQELLEKPLTKEQLASWADRYASLVKKAVITAPEIAGARSFLESMPAGVEGFVISGTPEKELIEIVAKRQLTGFFKEILGSPTGKIEHLTRLLASYRLDPANCVFIGDAMTDYEAAEAVGMAFVGIRGAVAFPSETMLLEDCRGLGPALSEIFAYPG